jgi:hypothetical protein
MKKSLIAGVLTLSLLIGTTAVAAASSSDKLIAAEKKDKKDSKKDAKKEIPKKLDAAAYKKKLADLNKKGRSLKRAQGDLQDDLAAAQESLAVQFAELLAAKPASEEPAASQEPSATTGPTASSAPSGSSVPAASTAPAGSAEPAASTEPAPATAEPAAPPVDPKLFLETLNKLSDLDAGLEAYFSAEEFDRLTTLADNWLASDKKAAKYAADFKKLEASFKSLDKQAKYQEALDAKSRLNALDEKTNALYDKMLRFTEEMSVTVAQVLEPALEDQDGDGEHENDDHHGDSKEDRRNSRGDN